MFLRYFLHSVTTSKILISGIPLQTRFEDIEPLLKPYGIVKQCEAISSKDQNTQTVHITFENPEQAQRYINPNKHKKQKSQTRNRIEIEKKQNPSLDIHNITEHSITISECWVQSNFSKNVATLERFDCVAEIFKWIVKCIQHVVDNPM